MIDYREIIRLKNLKFSNVAIANSLCCSRNTVSEVFFARPFCIKLQKLFVGRCSCIL